MYRVMLRSVLALLVAASAVPAAAQAKVAVIDVQRVELKELSDRKVQEGQGIQQELAELREQFNKQRFTLSEDKLEAMTKDIEDRQIALQRFEDDAQRELNEARRRALGALEQRIMPVIDAVGQEKGLTLIFNKFQSGLVYADDTVDITDEVIRRFNTIQ